MEKTAFDDAYKIWIWQNVSRGCDKARIFRALYLRGFDYDAIRDELGCEPPEGRDGIGESAFELLPVEGPSPSLRQPQYIFFPHAERLDAPHLEVYTIEDFLDADECAGLMALAENRLTPSTVTTGDEGYRTSRTCNIAAVDDPLVRRIDERVCALFGLYPQHPEPAQIQFYRPGEYFRDHEDTFSPDTASYIEHAARFGQRVWTLILYLNDTEHGGATLFPHANQIICPRSGLAVFWNNLYDNGELNPNALHRALPVDTGVKVIYNKWVRENRFGDADIANPGRDLPNYTCDGFKVETVPADTFDMLASFYRSAAVTPIEEYVEGGYLTGNPGSQPSVVVELPHELKRRVSDDLQPLLEAWSGQGLEPTAVYGLRDYRRGASLRMHVDRTSTHIISASLNIAQDVEEDWPFELIDHHFRRHALSLAPGQMVFYEGARMMHGRPQPLAGDSFCNLFVHFRPLLAA